MLFFNAGEPYRVSHPVAGGDANLSLAIGEEQLRELAPRSLLQERATTAFKPQRLRIDARAQALVALLRHGLRSGAAEPLEAEGLVLTLVRRSLGPRTTHAVDGPRARGGSSIARARPRKHHFAADAAEIAAEVSRSRASRAVPGSRGCLYRTSGMGSRPRPHLAIRRPPRYTGFQLQSFQRGEVYGCRQNCSTALGRSLDSGTRTTVATDTRTGYSLEAAHEPEDLRGLRLQARRQKIKVTIGGKTVEVCCGMRDEAEGSALATASKA